MNDAPTPPKTNLTVEEIVELCGKQGINYIQLNTCGGDIIKAEIFSINGPVGTYGIQHSKSPGLALQRAYDVWIEKRNSKKRAPTPAPKKKNKSYEDLLG